MKASNRMITGILAVGAISFAGVLAAPAAFAAPELTPSSNVSSIVRSASTMPSIRGSAVPGGVTGFINMVDRTTHVRGVATITAPPGTTFDRVSVNLAQVAYTFNEDRTSATITGAHYGGGVGATIQILVRLPANAKPTTEFSGGTVTITSASDSSILTSGEFSVLTTWPAARNTTAGPSLDATSVFTGTGTPGEAVSVKDGSGNVIATATVGDDGTWNAPLLKPIADGPVSATITVGTTTLPVAEYAMKNASRIVSPVAGTVLEPNQVFTGVGEPGSTVAVTDANGNAIAEAVVAPDGSWSATQTGTLPAGPNELFLISTSVGGVTETTSQGTFMNTDESPVDTPVLDPAIAGGLAMASLAGAGTVLVSRRRSAALRG